MDSIIRNPLSIGTGLRAVNSAEPENSSFPEIPFDQVKLI
jgi:hypothetical protein